MATTLILNANRVGLINKPILWIQFFKNSHFKWMHKIRIIWNFLNTHLQSIISMSTDTDFFFFPSKDTRLSYIKFTTSRIWERDSCVSQHWTSILMTPVTSEESSPGQGKPRCRCQCRWGLVSGSFHRESWNRNDITQLLHIETKSQPVFDTYE